MQLGCLPVSLFPEIIQGRMTVADWAKMGASLDLDGIDLSILFVPDRSEDAVAKLRHDIENAGTRVVMVASYPDFTHPDPAQRERELRLAEEVVAVSVQLGAIMVRVTAGQAHPETKRAEGIAWAVNGLTRLVEFSRGTGITLVYENHAKPGAWEHTDFSQPPEIFLEIVRATAPCGLGINFDTGNAAAFADDPVDLLEHVLPRVVSVHAADTAIKGELRPVLLGDGVTPFSQLFARLHQAGWDGWICIEEASRQGLFVVEEAIRFVRQTWNPERSSNWLDDDFFWKLSAQRERE